MMIAIGSDHHGVDLRHDISRALVEFGYAVEEFGPPSSEAPPVDYPDVAAEVAARVSDARAERGVLICGTGLGMSIVANKFSGVRAGAIWDELTAELSRRHNNLNVLCLSADLMANVDVKRIVQIWLDTPFEGGRHASRVEKIATIERRHATT